MMALLGLQIHVLEALVLRETRAAFGASHIGYLWAVIVPATSIAVLVAVFTLAGRNPPYGSSFALFFATGVLTLQFFSKLSSSLMAAFEANKALLTYPPIKELDVLVARALLISATYAVVFLLVFCGIIFWDTSGMPAHLGRTIEAFAVTALLGTAFGVLNAVILSIWDSWRHLEKILTSPLFFLSGIFYVPSLLPPDLMTYLSWNPILHVVEWMRDGFYPDYDSTILDRAYLMRSILVLLLVGFSGERLFRKRRTA
ncbi:ABC transporter permease [Ochrobactrum sp. RH2CCR150]|uniref:ABC transporter permease n=1 Tax=Ochrobactrum sp. RH2CCR150 TaxID=2587044 RepID=UPI0015FE20DC|nr:capsular polysaccharide transport system permease protein [Ochrobactrum sp. RH2CCR150]